MHESLKKSRVGVRIKTPSGMTTSEAVGVALFKLNALESSLVHRVEVSEIRVGQCVSSTEQAVAALRNELADLKSRAATSEQLVASLRTELQQARGALAQQSGGGAPRPPGAQAAVLRASCALRVALLTHLFTRVLPPPLPAHTPARPAGCFWAQRPLRPELRHELLQLLGALQRQACAP